VGLWLVDEHPKVRGQQLGDEQLEKLLLDAAWSVVDVTFG
jgi:hypothetical protein